MKNMSTKQLVLTGLFAALVFVGTFSIQLPLPTSAGYIHLGDTFIYIAGAFLGPVFGGLAGGIGSMLADLMLGYAIYAPATFVIKALNGVIVGLAMQHAIKAQDSFLKKMIVFTFGSALAGATMVGGYYLYETFMFPDAALANIAFNLTQAIGSMVVASVLYVIFKNPALSKGLK